MERAEQTPTANLENDRLDLVVSPDQRQLLDEAAAESGLSVDAFVLDRATEAARDVLADCSGVVISEERWKSFLALLDRDPRPGPSWSPRRPTTALSQKASRSFPWPCSPRLGTRRPAGSDRPAVGD